VYAVCHLCVVCYAFSVSCSNVGDKVVGVATKSMTDYDEVMHMISCMTRYDMCVCVFVCVIAYACVFVRGCVCVCMCLCARK
jgi:hypothetical protein